MSCETKWKVANLCQHVAYATTEQQNDVKQKRIVRRNSGRLSVYIARTDLIQELAGTLKWITARLI